MTKSYSLYYLLFVLLIMGTFASMAQNDYGITILGFVAFAFAILFAVQLFALLRKKEPWDPWKFLELTSLVLLGVILGMRVFYLHFVFVKMLFGISGVMLALVFVKRLMTSYLGLKTSSQWLGWLMVCFYASLVFYTLSMVVTPFIPDLSLPLGVIAFLWLLAFVILGFMKRNLLVDGENISAFTFVYKLKDRSLILVSLYLLFTFYIGFTSMNLLPKIYSNEFPQGYFQLIESAEGGKEKAVNGKYKHDEFKDSYDRFMDHQKQ